MALVIRGDALRICSCLSGTASAHLKSSGEVRRMRIKRTSAILLLSFFLIFTGTARAAPCATVNGPSGGSDWRLNDNSVSIRNLAPTTGNNIQGVLHYYCMNDPPSWPGRLILVNGTISPAVGTFQFSVNGLLDYQGQLCNGGHADIYATLLSPGCNLASVRWVQPNFPDQYFTIRREPSVPTTELVVSDDSRGDPPGWDPELNYRPVHFWNQNLRPFDYNFTGQQVQEWVPFEPPLAIDTCYFDRSLVPRLDRLPTTGTWNVTGTQWGDDEVGWTEYPVRYYRSVNRAPCTAIVYQDMRISDYEDFSGTVGWRLYRQATLTLEIGTRTVAVTRESASRVERTLLCPDCPPLPWAGQHVASAVCDQQNARCILTCAPGWSNCRNNSCATHGLCPGPIMQIINSVVLDD